MGTLFGGPDLPEPPAPPVVAPPVTVEDSAIGKSRDRERKKARLAQASNGGNTILADLYNTGGQTSLLGA